MLERKDGTRARALAEGEQLRDKAELAAGLQPWAVQAATVGGAVGAATVSKADLVVVDEEA